MRLAPFLCRGFLLGYIPTPAGETRNEWQKIDASHDFIPLYYSTLLTCILILSIYFTFSFFSKREKVFGYFRASYYYAHAPLLRLLLAKREMSEKK